jgi:hypothetical protein
LTPDGKKTIASKTWVDGDTEISETKIWNNMEEVIHGHVAETPADYHAKKLEEARAQFQNWAVANNKNYDNTSEFEARFELWNKNDDLIERTNRAAD